MSGNWASFGDIKVTAYHDFMVDKLFKKTLKIYEKGEKNISCLKKIQNVNAMHYMDLQYTLYTLDFDFQSFLLNHCEEIRKCSWENLSAIF